jgi:hypothetical protein
VAIVSIDTLNHNDVKVTLNGTSEEFSPSLVANITYTGGSGGGDSFTDATRLVSLNHGHGGNNVFIGGSNYNYIFFHGNNTYTGVANSISAVFRNGSRGNIIYKLGSALVQVYP